MTQPNYITRRGMETFRAELSWLHSVERPRITAEVSYAASLGDRSENAEYIYGKKRLREIDGRIHHILGRLNSAQVIDPAEQQGPKARFGATVRTADERGEEQTWTIYGVDEVNVALGVISWRSPLGHALLGKEEGEIARFQTPQGTRQLDLLEVRYDPQPTGPIPWPPPEK